jgi:hypothetical protein
LANQSVNFDAKESNAKFESDKSEDNEDDLQDVEESAPPSPPPSPPTHSPPPPPHTSNKWQELTNEECWLAIFSSKPDGAVGHDGIPFSILQLLWPFVRHWISDLYRASVRQRHHPLVFKLALGLVLKKPKEPDYSLPKAYQLISFEPTLARGLEKVMERSLSWLAEARGMLPEEAFGGRPGQSMGHALHYLVDKVKSQWRKGNIVVAVALNIKGATPSVVKARLLNERE